MMLIKSTINIRRPPSFNFYFLLLLVYFLLYQYCRIYFYDDPTSHFFNPEKAFAPGYSVQRQEEATAFLRAASNLPFKRLTNDTNPRLCVGIATVAREGVNYLHLSTGSLLQGLTLEERQEIELKILIAHTDSSRHPNLNSDWLHNVVDEVLDYGEGFKNESYVKGLEGVVSREPEKSLFDYTNILGACKDSGADYVLIIEDDTVSAKGWYRRTLKSLESVAVKMRRMGRDPSSFLYLRLFYTEKFLGWSSEHNTSYATLSILTILATFTLFLVPNTTRPKFLKPPHTILFLAIIYVPLLIALFFLSGCPSVLPISRGVHLMPKYACCTQGLVFPSSSIPGILDWLDTHRTAEKVEFQDHLIEEYADQDKEGRLRWALTPSVVQHIGSKTSKAGFGGGWGSGGRKNPRFRLWSYAFEREGWRINRGVDLG